MERPKRANVSVTYSEILRVVGGYVDRAHLTEVRVLETEEGVILQGLLTTGEHAGERATYQLTSEDLQMLMEDAIDKRGKRM